MPSPIKRAGAPPAEEPVASRARVDVAAAASEEAPAEIAALIAWVISHGGCDALKPGGDGALRVAPSAEMGGGLGVFAGPRGVAPGARIAACPRACVLTAPRALASDVGRACRAALPQCSAECVVLRRVVRREVGAEGGGHDDGRTRRASPTHRHPRAPSATCGHPRTRAPLPIVSGRAVVIHSRSQYRDFRVF